MGGGSEYVSIYVNRSGMYSVTTESILVGAYGIQHTARNFRGVADPKEMSLIKVLR